jgi:hypothetical protein
MELMAAIRGLEALTRPCRVTLSTDSMYVKDGITKWVHNWRRNGWRTADKKPVKNAELWQALCAAAERHRSTGSGSRAMPAMPRTSGSTSWPAPRRRACAARPRGPGETRADRRRVASTPAGTSPSPSSSAAPSCAAAGAVWIPKPPCPTHQKKSGQSAAKPIAGTRSGVKVRRPAQRRSTASTGQSTTC